MPRSCASMALGLPGAAAIRVIGFEHQNLDGIYVRDKTREIRNHPVFIQGATRAGTPSTAEGVHLMCLDARRCWWCVQFLRILFGASGRCQKLQIQIPTLQICEVSKYHHPPRGTNNRGLNPSSSDMKPSSNIMA